jgi:predicted NBD/HSP70 family sugar kinase
MSRSVRLADKSLSSASPRVPKQSPKPQGADLTALRTFNRRLIFKYLREQEQEELPTSRVAIADELGLSRATVTSIIEELKKEGFVQEGGKFDIPFPQKGGRPANRIHFNANAGYVLAMDIGRSHLTIYLTNLLTDEVGKWSGPFDMISYDGHTGLKFVAERTHDLVKSKRVPWSQIRGIGVALPGVPDPSRRMLISPPLLHRWFDIDIPASLRRQLNLGKKFMPIYLDNDASLGALGESRYGAGRGVSNFVYIKVGIGIGAGLILNGSLFRGSKGAAGEIGHVILGEDGSERYECPSCEGKGCLEAMAGVGAIVEDARHGTSLTRVYAKKGLDLTSISPALANFTHKVDMADVIQKADEGDEACQAALKSAGKRIGIVIGSSLLNIYNPSTILLDGGAIRVEEEGGFRVNERLLAALRESAKACTLQAAWAGVEISASQLGDIAVALGAVATVIDNDKDFGISGTKALSLMRQAE